MICVVIQMFGHVSGGHMNPAVTVGMLFAFQISPLRAILYVIAQCGGGLLGSLILKRYKSTFGSLTNHAPTGSYIAYHVAIQ